MARISPAAGWSGWGVTLPRPARLGSRVWRRTGAFLARAFGPRKTGRRQPQFLPEAQTLSGSRVFQGALCKTGQEPEEAHNVFIAPVEWKCVAMKLRRPLSVT